MNTLFRRNYYRGIAKENIKEEIKEENLLAKLICKKDNICASVLDVEDFLCRFQQFHKCIKLYKILRF